MKKIYTPILSIILLAFQTIPGFSQNIELGLSPELNCGETTYCATVLVRAKEVTGFELGTSSILLTYDKDVLAFKNYTSLQFHDGAICNGVNAWAPHQYDANSRAGEFEVTLNLWDNDNACPTLKEGEYEVGIICFDILRQGSAPNIAFDPTHTQFNQAQPDDGSGSITITKYDALNDVGTLACDCPGEGTPCDDNNVYTVNDTYDVFCSCQGVYQDCDEDGVFDGVDGCKDINYEAEDATLTGNLQARNSFPQFSGLAYVDYASNGDIVEFDIEVLETGLHTFQYRYALGTSNKFIDIRIDGDLIIQNLLFETTLEWTVWDTVETSHFLAVGSYKVELVNKQGNGVNLDQLIVSNCSNCDLAGTPCDDGDPCTIDDVFDTNCNCGGAYLDDDKDGVCNTLDVCEGGDDHADLDNDGIPDFCDTCDNSLIGTPCDDENPCTENDKIDQDCNCIGTFVGIDSDNDGVCDAYDICPGDDDNLDADGDGTPDGCDPCDDRTIWGPCDDGDPCTLLDVVTPDCGCVGIFYDSDGDGVCNAEDLCDGYDDTIDIDGDGMPDACDTNVPISSKMEYGVEPHVTNQWRTVYLTNDYNSMVVVATPIMPTDDHPPVVTRIRNAQGNTFEVLVQNPSNEFKEPYEIQYMVAEEGVYTKEEHGIKMEAKKDTAYLTANASGWVREARTYQQAYSVPVVLGQVMSYEDPQWSVFWASQANSQSTPPDSTNFAAGKHVAEDTMQIRNNEEIGYFVIEEGNYFFNGINMEVKNGANTVAGVQGAGETGYAYDLTLNNATRAVLSAIGMNGGNGGWPVLFGEFPFRGSSLYLAFDEDQIFDTERSHITEEIAYVAFESVLPLSTSISTTQPKCFGDSDGSATATVLGGTEPYQYNWSNGGTNQSIDGLQADVYTVTVTDAVGITVVLEAEVTNPEHLSVSASSNNIDCFGANNGSASAQFSGGTGTVNYYWSTGAQGAIIDNLTPGIYEVSVVDQNQCLATNLVQVTQPEQLIVNTEGENVNCYEGADGSVTATFAGGTGNVNYTWSNGETNQTIENLPTGTYQVTATDENGCTAMNSYEVSQPDELQISLSTQNATCYDENNGIAEAAFTGGTGSVNYNWSNGEQGAIIENLAPGIYEVTATDQNGCSKVKSVEISEPELLTVSASSEDVSCNGGEDGKLSASFSGGTGTVNYEWSNGAQGATIEDLPAGNYEVTATDENGCTAITTMAVIEPEALNVSIIADNVLCHSGGDGMLTASFTGGTGMSTYEWSTGETGTTIENISAGTYHVTATDENGCTAVQTKEITEPDELMTTLSSENVLCFGGNNGSAEATFTGGTGNVTFSWSNGAQGAIVENLVSGIYVVTATDGNGCTTTNEVEITEPEALQSSIASQNVLCFGGSDGSANASFTGGTGAVTYLWNTGATTASIDNLSTGIYEVVLTDEHGCTTSNTIEITAPEEMISTNTQENISCYGMNDGAASAAVSGGTGDFIYLWNTGATTANIDNLSAGEYEVIVTDENGCTLSNTFEIIEPEELVSSINIESHVSCFGQNDGEVIASSMGGTGTIAFEWSNGNFDATNASLYAGIYEVTVTDENGCTSTNTVEITEPEELLADITGVDVTCFGEANGEASVSYTGGTGTASYLWSTGDATPDVDNLIPGVYEVTVTDENFCFVVQTIAIEQPEALTLIVDQITDETNSNMDGAISITPAGGVGAPYTFEWYVNGDLVSTEEDPIGLSAGDYTLIITDNNGCSITETVVVQSITGTIDVELDRHILVSPNPTSGIFFIHFDFPVTEKIAISIFDPTGKQLIFENNEMSSEQVFEYDLSNHAAGVYLVRIVVDDKMTTRRIVVSRN